MKKKAAALLLLLLVLVAFFAFVFFAPATAFDDKTKTFVIDANNNTPDGITEILAQNEIIKVPWAFKLLANQLHIWKKVKPGKFEVKRSDNLIGIVRTLRNNKQIEVKLIINKLRTNEDLAHLISKNFSTDSVSVIQFLSNNDSLKPFNIDTNNLATILVPNTYSFYWATSFRKILGKLKAASDDFWVENNRLEKAKAMGFSPKEIVAIASIVEEETNVQADKGKIASVYINRLHKGMALGADPTIKFALKDFSIKQVLFQHLSVQSPYNTYKNKGFPPGPICTPSINTLDAVLDAPATDYLYFVAKPDFSGYSNFSSNFAEHSQYAKQYHKALEAYLLKKKKAIN